MAKDWKGVTYNEDWIPINAMGEAQGPKDYTADAEWNAANKQNTGPGATSWQPTAPAAPSPFATNVQNKLTSELNLSDTVNQNDPAYQQQLETFRFNADRNTDRQRAAMAQRMHAQGTATGGGLDTGVERLVAQQGEAEQGFEGDLLKNFRQQNIDRMSRALQLGTGLMSQEQEQNLRAALAREGYALQKELATADLDFRKQSFYDQLGQNLGLSEAQLNQQAMLGLLG